MILVFALAGSFTATIAGVTAMMMGQSWWIGMASYIGTGLLTVFVLGAFTAFGFKTPARKADHSKGRSGLTLAEH